MAKQILETNNYSKFEMTEFNRDVKNTKALETSMSKHGFLDACPLHVVRNGEGKLKIKQGHHRFIAAKNLGIPIKYVECKDSATISELERTTKKWSMTDYLISYCRLGNPDYLKIQSYCDESGINLQSAISMLGGQSAGSGNFGQIFKEGKFKIKRDSDHAFIVKDIVLLLKKYGVTFFRNTTLVQAISKVLWVKEFDVLRLKSKLKLFSPHLEKKATLDQYLDLIEEIYNRQSHNKIPLKFLANEAAKERTATFSFPKKG